MLPMDIQRVLYNGRHRAKNYKQLIHWDTTDDMTVETAGRVYSDLYGQERAAAIQASMSRAKKEAEAKARLEGDNA